MKKLQLKNPSYEYLEKAFREWLGILGYSTMTVYNMPNIIREFLHFLEQQDCKHIKELNQKHIRNYYQHISSRSNERRGGGLSNNYVNKHLQAIEKFLEFLSHKGVQNLPGIGIRQLKLNHKEITILSPEEIKMLYKATERETDHPKQEILNARDRALLTIFYGCGLRRNEGVHLCIDDVNLDTRILHIRKGKNYKERFVPFNKTGAKYLQDYIYDHRPTLLKDKKESRLFISVTGKPMIGGTLYSRLKMLQLLTEDTELQQKQVTLHNLRHSIATHLLQAGMGLEKIARFLGHSSLESTQIYTHLVEQQEKVS